MGIILVLISISLSIAIFFLAVFYWNMKSGQYDDTYTPSVRILFDNQTARVKRISKEQEQIKEKIDSDKPSQKEMRASRMARS